MKTRILFTGAQGTGKTSVMDCLSEDVPQVRNITRTVAKNNNLSINTNGTDEGQKTIFNAYKSALEQNKFFVAERSLIDVYAYTLYQASIGKCSGETVRAQMRDIKSFVQRHKNDIYVYFPIEFEPVDDGVRSVDKEYQKAIDEYIHDTLDYFKLNYIKISGSVKERTKLVNELIYENNHENIKRSY